MQIYSFLFKELSEYFQVPFKRIQNYFKETLPLFLGTLFRAAFLSAAYRMVATLVELGISACC